MPTATPPSLRRPAAALILVAAATCAPSQPSAASEPADEVNALRRDAPRRPAAEGHPPRLTVEIVAAPGYDYGLLRSLLARRRTDALACYRDAMTEGGGPLAAEFDARFAVVRTNRVIDRQLTRTRGAAELRPCVERLLAGDLPSNCKGPARVDVALRVGFVPAPSDIEEAP